MISTEASPFAKVGGLAEAIPPLARALAELGHDLRLVLPRYYFIDRSQLEDCGILGTVPFEGQRLPLRAFRGTLPDSAIPVYFVEAEEFFGRDGVYGTLEEKEFPDNARRFAFFCRACFALCRAIGWIPDIVHSHDWPAGPAMAFLDIDESHDGFEHSRGVFTIHNIAYQGLFPAEQFRVLDLGAEQFSPGSFEFFGRLNFMQGAIRHCQAITTVSPGYAGEITTNRFGFGLEGILQERRSDLQGILNGLDYRIWNPRTDPLLAAPFDHDDLAGKAQCKQALQELTTLDVRPDCPLVGIVSRLVSQKGFFELLSPGGLPRLMAERDVQVVVLGSGEAWCENGLYRLAAKYPKRLAFHGEYHADHAHRVTAGSDFLLMPSLLEPCGLSQMAALRYGAVPLVSLVGGLADTVRTGPPDNPAAAPATGLAVAQPASPDSIFRMVSAALDLYATDPAGLEAMRRRGMQERFDWSSAARAYERLFRNCLAAPRY